jgi:hypothetical protein
MSTITYDNVHSTGIAAPAAAPALKREGRFARIMARLIEARQRQANYEIRRLGFVLPNDLEQTDWKVAGRSEDSLPFVR